MSKLRMTLAAMGATLLAGPAVAHPVHLEQASFTAGFLHPLTGADHLIAMVAVGVWAATLGRKAMMPVPAAFVGAMLAGFALSVAGVAVPMVEPMILVSVVVLGVLVALAVRADLWIAAATVALAGLFHGAAHGAEVGAAGAMQFGLGFVFATAALHVAGLGLGMDIGRSAVGSRVLGVGAAAAGIALALG
ncbi:MAG: HupE/UreJ family protein [Rhodobacterales bacterium]|nr:HupE/UreJ family protein [Rhodobacterales bacterium]